ncbi:Probable lipoprotein precursor [Flavobacterium indicum GPTSA100-9 = DSM 17447]|uniref:Probable lipoprotein n=1 Tax=Flavobacterium indicum (strain DSM 17447 / CIP 109464 / GPTSA100-9) TaxID=1094466 RepID=H8XP20_FLAIG|nr:Omp28-related outer membrane protein [Flavobacterium indicum]CCG52287.1 Probable lipoprotein precursor [Flavobacterium indicum GPTSA100-9 = DSM 17447]
MKKLLFSAIAISLLACSNDEDSNSGSSNNNQTETPIAGKFKKNVLIEDFTGTWCGYCPRVAFGIQKVENEGLAAIPVAIHRGSTNPSSSGYDPFNYEASALESYIGLTGYPTAKLNRKIDWINETSINEPKNLIKLNSDLGLALNSTVSGGNINLDVNIKFDANLTGLKLVVYVLEDNLIQNQTNYTSYFGGASTLTNFEHDHVLRACLTNLVDGDDLTGTTDGATVTKNFNLAIPSNITNSANMSFVAFVIDSSGKAINVRSAAPNVNQTFEENL